MRVLVMVVGCLLFSAMLSAGCEKMKPAEEGAQTSAGPAESPAPAATETAKTPGTVATIVIGPQSFSAEVAQSDREREIGLMGRQEPLAANSGMWFVFPASDSYPFWMKNTLIPLDWVFVDEDANGQMTVVDIRKNNQPNDEAPYTPAKVCRYVLEVNAGTADAKGIKVGDVVQYRIGN